MKTMFCALWVLVFLPVAGLAADRVVKDVSAPPATLKIFNRDIVKFRATLDGATPAMRLHIALERLQAMSSFSLYSEIAQKGVQLDDFTGVLFYTDAGMLFGIVDADMPPGSDQGFDEFADQVRERLDVARQAALEQSRPTVILRGVGLAALATIALLVLVRILKSLHKRMRAGMVRRAAGVSWLKVREFDLRQSAMRAMRSVIASIIWVAGLFGGYVWLGFVLAQFPYTAPWSDRLGLRVRAMASEMAQNVVAAIPSLVTAAVIFAVTRWIAGIVSNVFKGIEQSRKESGILTGDTARATRRIVVVLVWVLGVVLAYPYIPGSDSEAFKGIGVLLGLMVSLGSSGVVSQLMSGFVLLYSGAVRTGEYALVGDVEGTVTEISLLSTRILTPRNEYVTVPNSVLVGKNTINYSRLQGEGRSELSTKVTIGYDTPWRQVNAMLIKATERTSGIRRQPAPHVMQLALSDWYIEYELRFVPGDVTQKGQILSNLHQHILDVFNEYGVQIMSPHFVGQPDSALLVPKEGWAPAPADETAASAPRTTRKARQKKQVAAKIAEIKKDV